MNGRKKPLLMRSALTGSVYIVTSYKDLGEGSIEALTKYDVTDQFNALVEAERNPADHFEQYGCVVNDAEFIPLDIMRAHMPFAVPPNQKCVAVFMERHDE